MEISTVIEEQDPTWMTPIIEFISKGTLPHELRMTDDIAARAEIRNFDMVSLYRVVPLQIHLARWVGPIRQDYVLREIHAGSCSIDIAGPSPVACRGTLLSLVMGRGSPVIPATIGNATIINAEVNSASMTYERRPGASCIMLTTQACGSEGKWDQSGKDLRGYGVALAKMESLQAAGHGMG
ncbi:hypothetical protein Tco_0772540 [Tanacetum coccineum]|uniref:Uncharacterized protein n=1 Tax=Tanacetum coccineum TaxID=301880 RepID=A0ABQ4ZI64_9ASTR